MRINITSLISRVYRDSSQTSKSRVLEALDAVRNGCFLAVLQPRFRCFSLNSNMPQIALNGSRAHLLRQERTSIQSDLVGNEHIGGVACGDAVCQGRRGRGPKPLAAEHKHAANAHVT